MPITVKKELETIKRNQVKLENSFSETKAELRPRHSKLNNVEKQISDLEDRIMKIIQLEQKTERQMKKMKATYETNAIIKSITIIQIWDPKRGSKRKGDQKYIWKNYAWQLPKLEEGNRYPGAGGTERTKQDEVKQDLQ